MFPEDDLPDRPTWKFWFLWTAAILALFLIAFFVTTAQADEIPLPRPKPSVCENTIQDFDRVLNAVEVHHAARTLYITGERKDVWLALYNASPPPTHLQADIIIAITPEQPLMLFPGNIVQPGQTDVRLYQNGCMTSRAVFPEKAWKDFEKRVERLYGTPV